MARFNQSVFDSLIELGIDPAQARAAASKFNTAERAINWVFDGGATAVGGAGEDGVEGDYVDAYVRSYGPSSTRATPSSSPRRTPSPTPTLTPPGRDRPSTSHDRASTDPSQVTISDADREAIRRAGPVQPTSGHGSLGLGTGTFGVGPHASNARRLEDLSFEEQLQMALEASTQETGPPPSYAGGSSGVGVGPMANPRVLDGNDLVMTSVPANYQGVQVLPPTQQPVRSGFGTGTGTGSGTSSGYASLANSMTLPPRPVPQAQHVDHGTQPPSSQQQKYQGYEPPPVPSGSESVPAAPPVVMGSNNPFLPSAASEAQPPPPVPARRPPIFARDLPPPSQSHSSLRPGDPGSWPTHSSSSSTITAGAGSSQTRAVSFGRVGDEAMNEEGRMVIRIPNEGEEDDEGEERRRRGRSPTPAAAKRARVTDRSSDPVDRANYLSTPIHAPSIVERADSMEDVIKASLASLEDDERRRRERLGLAGPIVADDQAEMMAAGNADTDLDVDMAGDEELNVVSAEEEVDDALIPDREPGHPVVLASKEDNVIFASHILQIMSSVPQFRMAIAALVLDTLDPNDADVRRIAYLQALFGTMDQSTKAFREISRQISTWFPLADANRVGMPTQASAFTDIIVGSWYRTAAMLRQENAAERVLDAETRRLLDHPRSLFISTASSTIRPESEPEIKFLLDLQRDASTRNLHEAMCRYIWTMDSSMGIDSLAEVFCLTIANTGGTELMALEEEFYFDPFLAQNRTLMQEYRALEDQARMEIAEHAILIEKLTWANVSLQVGGSKRVRIDSMLASAIAHFEGPNAQRSTAEEIAIAEMMVEKLNSDRANLQSRLKGVTTRYEALKVYVTDLYKGPKLQEHKYLLRGVIFHAGFVGPTAFACYWRDHSGQWWKGQGYQATKTDVGALNADTMGLWLDGGPYFLVYSRDGPRPENMPYPEEMPRSTVPVAPVWGPAKPDATAESQTFNDAPLDILDDDSPDVGMLQDPMLAKAVSTIQVAAKEEEEPGAFEDDEMEEPEVPEERVGSSI